MKIALIQYDIIWEDIDKNLRQLSHMLCQLTEGVDIVVLPEMFSTGFSMDVTKVAQTMNGEIVQWMSNMASQLNCAITGTVAIKDGNKVFNRALFVHPGGSIEYYNKRHLFRMGDEHCFYTAGEERKIINYKGVRLMLQVCYDLRFPIWSRNRNDYDLLIYMANWPASRQSAWDILLKARAIENQSYIIGVNRIGVGGNIKYKGGSVGIDFKGNIVAQIGSKGNQIKLFDLKMDELNTFRDKFPVYLDADKFNVELK